MNLLYKSTRDAEKTVTASQAILKGLADDGGLFVPVSIPKLPVSLGELKEMTYQEIAYTVMKEFLTDFTEEELKSCIAKAYDSKFDTEEIAPLAKVEDAYYLELFHGATIAFKDMALSILPHLMITSARKNQVKNDIVILTATSVSITVETLKELGKLKTKSGNAILGAAIIDDVLGIIALTLITSMADESVKISIVLLKIIGFFIFVAVAGFIFYKFFSKWSAGEGTGLQRHVIVSFVFCLFMSYAAEQFFGVADITGAYFAGLIISMTQREPYIASRFDVLSYTYLSPIFFASIGLKVSLPEMNGTIVAFAVVLTIVAILTKVVGCGLGAKLCHYKNYQAIRIGVGMISRGEVALIVASKGESLGMMSTAVMGPVVIVVILTTIIAPILLKPVFKRGPETTPDPNVDMSKNYEAINKFREGK